MLEHECQESLPRFTRLNYFYGQALSHVDFRDAQRYVRDKLRLRNRCIHGWGVICGLDVTVEPSELDPCCPMPDCDLGELRERAERLDAEAAKLRASLDAIGRASAEAAAAVAATAEGLDAEAKRLRELAEECGQGEDRERSWIIRVASGAAISPCGDELVVPDAIRIDAWHRLSPAERRIVASGRATALYVSACYCETPSCPVRPISFDNCGPFDDMHARITESVDISVSLEPPALRQSCNPCCCGPGTSCCVLLARVDLRGTAPVVDNDVRRMLALYEPVRITEVTWHHGATYSVDQTRELFGRRRPDGTTSGIGLTIHFSRPIRAASVAPGVFEVLRYFGGQSPAGTLASIPFAMDPPSGELVDSITFRQDTDEYWSPGDRALIVLRADYVLDACCIPIDGSPQAGAIRVRDDDGAASRTRPGPGGRIVSRSAAAPWVAQPSAAAAPVPEPTPPAAPPPATPAPGNPTPHGCDPRLFRLVASRPGGRFESWIYVG
jgi:hypothetical protein